MTPAAPAGVEQALGGEVMRERPAGTLHAGQWNELQIIMDAQAPKLLMNEGDVTLSGATPYTGYGPIALYVGGSGEVRFKDLGYKDLNRFTYPAETTSSRFRLQRLREYFMAWSVGVADVNHDGVNDIVSGPYVYYAPAYTTSREIYIAESYDVHKQYPRGSRRLRKHHTLCSPSTVKTALSPSIVTATINAPDHKRGHQGIVWMTLDLLSTTRHHALTS